MSENKKLSGKQMCEEIARWLKIDKTPDEIWAMSPSGELWPVLDMWQQAKEARSDAYRAFIRKFIETSYTLSSVSDKNSLGEEITSESMTCNYCGADAAFFGWQNSIVHAPDCLVLEAEELLK